MGFKRKDKLPSEKPEVSSSATPEKNQSKVVPSDRYNVLLLGETQAGKSTFIQTALHYANPHHRTMSGVIGNGCSSCTENVTQYSVSTHLPTFEVVDIRRSDSNGSHPVVEYSDLNIYDYEDALNTRVPPQGPYMLKEVNHGNLQKVEFNLYDTPGLNDTNGNDEIHMANIFDELKKAGNIHLVLLVVGQSPFTSGFRNAIRSYIEAYPQLQDIMAIVHTRTDYINFHGDHSLELTARCRERSQILHEIIGRNNFPPFWIDCNLTSLSSIRKCITYNLMQEILKDAMFNQPISLNSTMMRKTPKMRDIDELIESKFGNMSMSLASSLQHMGNVQKTQAHDMLQLREKIARNESEQENTRIFLLDLNTDSLELLDELRIDENWEYFQLVHPGTAALRELDLTIDILNVRHPGFKLSDQKGGEGFRWWTTRYKRKSYQNAVLHVRAYIKKCNKYRHLIDSESEWMIELKLKRELLEKERLKESEQSKELQQEVEMVLDENSLLINIVKIARERYMRPDLFRALAEAGAYRRSPMKSLQKVVDVLTTFLASTPGLELAFKDNTDVIFEDGEVLTSPSLPNPIEEATSTVWPDQVNHPVSNATVSTPANTVDPTSQDEEGGAVALQVASTPTSPLDKTGLQTSDEREVQDAALTGDVITSTTDTSHSHTLGENESGEIAPNHVVVSPADTPDNLSITFSEGDWIF